MELPAVTENHQGCDVRKLSRCSRKVSHVEDVV